jgi:hypothetical protein
MRLPLSALALATALTPAPGALAQQGDAARGADTYRDVCGMCHLPDPRQDRPARAIGVPGGVLRALETIGPMRFLLDRLSAHDIADVQAWLDTLVEGYIRDPRALNGNWFDPASAGQGLAIAIGRDDALSVLFFGHRDDAGNLLLTGAITRRPRYGEMLSIPLSSVSGGRFTSFDASRIRYEDWGTLTLRFTSCSSAEAELAGRDGRQRLQLVPLTRVDGLACD